MIKTIGDEVMVVGADPGALVDWAVGFQELNAGERPLPRIGMHAGEALYRDGDYYGRAVNLASRVGARAAGGEVLVTRAGRARRPARHSSFEPIGEVKLKGFGEADRAVPRASAAMSASRSASAPAGCSAGPVVVLLSGGRDSVCLLDLAVRLAGAGDGAARQLRAARRRRTPTRRTAARCASGSASRVRGARGRARRAGNVQAWARERALRRGGAARGARR